MHIPENYLSPSTCAVMTAAMVPVWTYSMKKIKTEIPKAKMPLLGIGAAFSFLGMMFNIPLPGELQIPAQELLPLQPVLPELLFSQLLLPQMPPLS